MNETVRSGSTAYDDYRVIADAQARYQDWQKEEWLRKVAALDWNRTNLDDYFGASFAGTPIADNYQALSRSGYMDSISPELALYLRYHDLLTTPRDDEGIAAWVWTSSFNPSTRKTTGAPWGIQGSEDWHQNLLTDGGSSTEPQAPDESEEEAQEAAKGAAEALLKAAVNGFHEGLGFGRPMEDSFAAKIREMLAGLVPMTPGMQQPGNMSAGMQQLAPMMTGDINSSVSVVIQTANIRSEQDIYSLADRINAAARANLAGIGLPEGHIDSENFAAYSYPRIRMWQVNGAQIGQQRKPEDGSEVTLDEEGVYEMLREAVHEKLEKGEDEPTAQITVSFVELGQTQEYRDIAQLQIVNLYDWVLVVHGPRKLRLRKQVSGYQFDCLQGRYLALELGDVFASRQGTVI